MAPSQYHSVGCLLTRLVVYDGPSKRFAQPFLSAPPQTKKNKKFWEEFAYFLNGNGLHGNIS
jgi:hypothetical protein